MTWEEAVTWEPGFTHGLRQHLRPTRPDHPAPTQEGGVVTVDADVLRVLRDTVGPVNGVTDDHRDRVLTAVAATLNIAYESRRGHIMSAGGPLHLTYDGSGHRHERVHGRSPWQPLDETDPLDETERGDK